MAETPNGRVGVGWAALSAIAGVLVGGGVVWQMISGGLDSHAALPWHNQAGLRISDMEARLGSLESTAARGDRWTADMQRQFEETMSERLGRLQDQINWLMKNCRVPRDGNRND